MESPKSRLIKWAGSKVGSATGVFPFLLQDRPYIEPFCGSAAFFFMGSAPKAFLNDTNQNLISFYEKVSANPKRVWRIYNSLPVSEEQYYQTRSDFNRMRCSAKKAAYFMYLNHFGFNGIYRTNKKGQLNTPFGARKKVKAKIRLEELMYYSHALDECELTCLDFEDFLHQLAPEKACIYMDPPYFTNDRRVFGEYGAKVFAEGDLHRLLHVSKWCADQGNRVVVSYRDCTEFRALFSDYLVADISVQRNVGGFSGRRKRDTELVAVLDKAA